MRCPGQDTRYWKPGAIFEAACPQCGLLLEFFKDDVSRICRNCGRSLRNPGLDFGCASYCKQAEKCPDELAPDAIFKQKVPGMVESHDTGPEDGGNHGNQT